MKINEDMRDGSLERGNPFETRVARGSNDDRKSRKQTATVAVDDESEAYCKHAQDSTNPAESAKAAGSAESAWAKIQREAR